MPEYNNGIPNNMVQPNEMPNTGATLPGLSDNMYQSQVEKLQAAQGQQMQPQQMAVQAQDRIDTADQIREGEIRENQRQRDMIDKAAMKAMEIHPDEFASGEYIIQEAKALTKPGKDRADTVRLTISIKDGLDFEMFFDEEGNFVMDNHKNDITPNLIGSKYLSLDNPEMDLSTPEKQKEYLEGFDNTKPGLTMQKEEIDKEIQEMGFENKEEMEKDLGIKVEDSLAKPEMSPNNTKQNIQSQAADNILKNATMVVGGDTQFDTTRRVKDVLNTPEAEKIVAVGSKAYSIGSDGKVKRENLIVQGPTPSVHLTGGHANDARLDQTFSSANNPTEGIGVGPGGSPQGVRNLTGEAAMTRSLKERGNTDTPTIDRLFEKHQDQGDHIEEMHGANGAEPISELHTDNDVTGLELQSISDRYEIPLDQIEQIYHNNLAHNMTPEEALDNTRKTCDNIYSQNMHEPTLEPRSPFDAPNE